MSEPLSSASTFGPLVCSLRFFSGPRCSNSIQSTRDPKPAGTACSQLKNKMLAVTNNRNRKGLCRVHAHAKQCIFLGEAGQVMLNVLGVKLCISPNVLAGCPLIVSQKNHREHLRHRSRCQTHLEFKLGNDRWLQQTRCSACCCKAADVPSNAGKVLCHGPVQRCFAQRILRVRCTLLQQPPGQTSPRVMLKPCGVNPELRALSAGKPTPHHPHTLVVLVYLNSRPGIKGSAPHA